jgi:hypothetical protein
MWVTTANADEGRVTQATCLYHQHNHSILMTEGVTVMSLSASHQLKTRVATSSMSNRVKLKIFSCMPNHVKLNIIA